MKKLICAAIAAGSMVAMAEECAEAAKCASVAAGSMVATAEECATKCAEAAKPASVAAEAAKPFKMADEQRAKMREQREKFMAERKAKMEAQILETVKKYVPEEEKAKALVKELQDAMMAGRRNMMQRRPQKPEGAKPAEAK